MKVLQLIQRPQLRGAEMFACQLSRELVTRGLVVDVCHLFDQPASLFSLFPDLNFLSLGGKEQRRLLDLNAYRTVDRMVSAGQYDLVQANAGDTLKYAALSKALYKWRTPLIFRNANMMSRFLRGRLHRKLNTWLLSKCDYIISVSETCRRDVVAVYPPAAQRSATIPIGTREFDDVEPAERGRDEPVFISVAGFVPEKNHHFLIDVFREFVAVHGKGQLWLVGEGPLRRDISQKVSEVGLQDRVTFYGAVTKPIALLKAADALLLPSLTEGLPGVILEAMACGVPVVASSAGGIAEVIREGETGFCVHRFSVKEYVACMEHVLNAGIRSKLSENGKEAIRRQFLLPVVAERFHKAYIEIVGHGR